MSEVSEFLVSEQLSRVEHCWFISVCQSNFIHMFVGFPIYICVCTPMSVYLSMYIHLSPNAFIYTSSNLYLIHIYHKMTFQSPYSTFLSIAPCTCASHPIGLTCHLFAALRVCPHRYLIVCLCDRFNSDHSADPSISRTVHPSVQSHSSDVASTVLFQSVHLSTCTCNQSVNLCNL